VLLALLELLALMAQEEVAVVVAVAAAGDIMALLAIPVQMVDVLVILVLQLAGVEEAEAAEAAEERVEGTKSNFQILRQRSTFCSHLFLEICHRWSGECGNHTLWCRFIPAVLRSQLLGVLGSLLVLLLGITITIVSLFICPSYCF